MIALDYNPTAQKVAEAGHALAKAIGAEVFLIHMMVDSLYYSANSYSSVMGFGGYSDTDFLQPNLVADLEKSTQDFLNQSKRHLGDDTIKIIIEQGNVADRILETAKNLNADVIVLGSHSQKWLEAIVMGSVTEEVLHHTLIPLYIIPTKNQN